jgi:UDP-N-acetylglucosamine/UDP-N-acetylgalactosamine 4-epimerase
VRTYDDALQRIRRRRRTWLVTGAAGFIGSHLAEALLNLGQSVVGLDDFSTGRRRNLAYVQQAVGESRWRSFRLIEGDIRSLATCIAACEGADVVLHQAALGSVPRSIDDPLATHESNVNGFLNMLVAARDTGVGRFVYASSSAVYGDHPVLPKLEERIGRAASPYGLSKHVNELYAGVFASCYGVPSIGLRYFNVFGPRQDPESAYAAVIPAWIGALLRNQTAFVNGDGVAARDFCYIDNVVQANLLAATAEEAHALDQCYNVAVGEKTSLNELFELIRAELSARLPHLRTVRPVYREPRRGDVQFSCADIRKAERLLGYQPRVRIARGLEKTIAWYADNLEKDVAHAA